MKKTNSTRRAALREFYEADRDNITKARKTDTRTPVLTLAHLNKIRKMREIEKLEKAQQVTNASHMYGATDGSGGEEF